MAGSKKAPLKKRLTFTIHHDGTVDNLPPGFVPPGSIFSPALHVMIRAAHCMAMARARVLAAQEAKR